MNGARYASSALVASYYPLTLYYVIVIPQLRGILLIYTPKA